MDVAASGEVDVGAALADGPEGGPDESELAQLGKAVGAGAGGEPEAVGRAGG